MQRSVMIWDGLLVYLRGVRLGVVDFLFLIRKQGGIDCDGEDVWVEREFVRARD